MKYTQDYDENLPFFELLSTEKMTKTNVTSRGLHFLMFYLIGSYGVEYRKPWVTLQMLRAVKIIYSLYQVSHNG